jgi:NAD-dependent deacetylase
VTVEVNAEPTPNTGFMDFALHGPAGEILPELAAGLAE